MSKYFKYLSILLLIRFLFLFLYINLIEIEYISQFTLLDDLGYLKNLRDNFNQLKTNFNLTTLRSIAGGLNSFYYATMFISFLIFGDAYFSPVILNSLIFTLVLTFFVSKNNFKWKYLLLVTLYPDIFIWSSFFNLKEAYIYSLLILFYLSGFERNTIKRNLYLGLILIITFNFRFYLPLILVTSIAIFKTLGKLRIINGYTLFYVFLGLFLCNLIVPHIDFPLIEFKNPFYGFIHFTLTPIPWRISNEYIFLLPGSILNPILILFFFYKKKKLYELNVIDILILLLMLFYSISDELQGPRHKSQIILLILVSILTNEKFKNSFTYSIEDARRSRKKLD